MAYNTYNPYNPYQNSYGFQTIPVQQSRDGIIRVTGIAGARAYQMPPNSREALFDDTDDIVFIKVTDGAGFPTLKAARLSWIDDVEKQQTGDYLTREEFAKWREEFEHGQQIVRRRSRAAESAQEYAAEGEPGA